MRAKNFENAYKPELVKFILGLDDAKYRFLSKTILRNKTVNYFTYHEIILYRIADFLLTQNRVRKSYLEFIEWSKLLKKLLSFEHNHLKRLTLATDITKNEIYIFNNHDNVEFKSSNVEFVELSYIMKQQINWFERFNFESIYSVRTVSNLLSISTKTINDWDKCFGLISNSPKLNSIEIFIYRLYKYFLIEKTFRKEELKGLDITSLVNFLRSYKGENIGNSLIMLSLEQKSILLFSNYNECRQYDQLSVVKPLKFLLENHFTSFERLGVKEQEVKTTTTKKIKHLRLVK